MKLTWHGHACFTVEDSGYTVCLDPYTGVTGYPELALKANACLCSHGHADHCHGAAVTPISGGESPFTIEKVETFHDDAQGEKRGTNTVHILSCRGLRVAHLGDLGHRLTKKQLAAIGPLDAVMIPVGGTYTVGPELARDIAEDLGATVIFPMHYRTGPYGFLELRELEDFLALYAPAEVVRLDGRSLELKAGMAHQVVVPAARF